MSARARRRAGCGRPRVVRGGPGQLLRLPAADHQRRGPTCMDVLGQIDLRYWQLASSDPMPEDFDVAVDRGRGRPPRRPARPLRGRAREGAASLDAPWAHAPRRRASPAWRPPAVEAGAAGRSTARQACPRPAASYDRPAPGLAIRRRRLRGARHAPSTPSDFVDVLQRGALRLEPHCAQTADACAASANTTTDGVLLRRAAFCAWGSSRAAGCGARCASLGRPCNGCRGSFPRRERWPRARACGRRVGRERCGLRRRPFRCSTRRDPSPFRRRARSRRKTKMSDQR